MRHIEVLKRTVTITGGNVYQVSAMNLTTVPQLSEFLMEQEMWERADLDKSVMFVYMEGGQADLMVYYFQADDGTYICDEGNAGHWTSPTHEGIISSILGSTVYPEHDEVTVQDIEGWYLKGDPTGHDSIATTHPNDRNDEDTPPNPLRINPIIAKYVGGQNRNHTGNRSNEVGIWFPDADGVGPVRSVTYDNEGLKYHEDWNWLMPVVGACYKDCDDSAEFLGDWNFFNLLEGDIKLAYRCVHDYIITNGELELATHKELNLIAREFSRIIRDWLTPEQLASVIASNSDDKSTCDTHDFCDANMAMDPAFNVVMGRSPAVQSNNDCATWGKAWDIAKANDFFYVKDIS
jgi:hypothetical protein